jgi:hypothetical protein
MIGVDGKCPQSFRSLEPSGMNRLYFGAPVAAVYDRRNPKTTKEHLVEREGQSPPVFALPDSARADMVEVVPDSLAQPLSTTEIDEQLFAFKDEHSSNSR